MSVRARVLLGVVVVAVVLVAGAVVTTRRTEAQLLEQVDTDLISASARDLGVGRDPGSGPERLSPFYVGIVTAAGVVPALRPNIHAEELPPPDITTAQVEQALQTDSLFTVGSDGDTRWRVRAWQDRNGRAAAVLALPLDGVDASVRRLVAVEAATTIAVLGVLAAVAWWVIHLGIRPIKRMTATATAIAAGDLSHRVPDVAPGTEAGELGVALNEMLSRIQAAFDERTRTEERLRRFASDASHELRTPVTTIRGYAELYRAGGLAEPGELDEAMRRTEQEAVRMGNLVEDLLALARLDQNRPLASDSVDLTAIVDDAARDARAVDRDRVVTVDAEPSVVVVGDEDRLRQVVANVVGNALVHTDAGTPIELRVARVDGDAVLEVVDHGAGMDAESVARAFERFYRADPSRSRHRGGSGLGLAIVDATVAAHAGTVDLDSTPGEGTTVRVRLPLSSG